MTTYTVRWEAQIDAEDATRAAWEARQRQEDSDEWGAAFWVIEDEKGEAWPEAGWMQIDLNSDPEDNA